MELVAKSEFNPEPQSQNWVDSLSQLLVQLHGVILELSVIEYGDEWLRKHSLRNFQYDKSHLGEACNHWYHLSIFLRYWGKFQHNLATPGSYNLCLALLSIPVSLELLALMDLTSIRFFWNSYLYQFKIPVELIPGYSWHNQGGTSLNLSPKIQIYILDIIVT